MSLNRSLLVGLAITLIAGASALISPIREAIGQAAGQVQMIAPLTREIGAIVTLTAQGAGTVNSLDQSGFNVTRIICVFRESVSGGTPSSTFAIQNKDAASGQYYTLLTSAAITTNSVNPISVGADLPNVANVSQGLPIARTWRVTTTVGGPPPAVTATIGCSLP